MFPVSCQKHLQNVLSVIYFEIHTRSIFMSLYQILHTDEAALHDLHE